MAFSRPKFRGISKAQETASSATVRDIRPVWLQLLDILSSRIGSAAFLVVGAILIVIFPAFSDIVFVLMLIHFWYVFFAARGLPFRLPIYCQQLDKNDLKPGTRTPSMASGIYFFGTDITSDEQLWLSNTDMRTHVLIFGSTGSGKTETLISIAYNALIQGSGFIYVDGKGDNSLFAKVFAMVRSMGREDDLLLINFMTGAQDITGPQKNLLSNTMNPFADGSSSMLSQLVVSLMDSGGGGASGSGSGDSDMWKGRAIAFTESLMRPLVWLRDNGYLLLDAALIRKYFVLDVIEDMLYDNKVIDANNNIIILDKPIPFESRDSIENYLSTLPGYKRSEKGKQSNKAYEQHGYITMQLTRVFGSLADVYGHIIKTQLAEVDFHDVVLNRRILVVLLPALEKSPDELSNLGKLVIASLKSMLASGLGSQVEGDYRDVIETKPTNASTPYLCVLDEYGYYAVKGFAVVPAQARSLGFSVVFAGQDLPAFQKASKEEAASICANTNIKICMKLEDPQETWEFFQKTAGETYVSAARQFQMEPGSTGLSYKDSREAQIDKRARIDLLDLKDQREGEAHVFFKANIVRAQMFYANPPKIKRLKLNQFAKVKGLSDKAKNTLSALFKSEIHVANFDAPPADPVLTSCFDLIKAYPRYEDVPALYQALEEKLQGKQEEETLDFGDQSQSMSTIFMSIPLEDRLVSEYFDVEVSKLTDSLLTKETLYQVVKKLSILEGKSDRFAKERALRIIDVLERETDYSICYPVAEGDVTQIVDHFIGQLNG